MDAQKKFYVDTLGGKLVKFGQNDQEIIEFPNVLLLFRPMQAPTGGSIGTTVNHIGFSVPNLKPLVAKLKANGFKVVHMTARSDLRTLPQYDEAVFKDNKLQTVSSRPTDSVVRTISE